MFEEKNRREKAGRYQERLDNLEDSTGDSRRSHLVKGKEKATGVGTLRSATARTTRGNRKGDYSEEERRQKMDSCHKGSYYYRKRDMREECLWLESDMIKQRVLRKEIIWFLPSIPNGTVLVRR